MKRRHFIASAATLAALPAVAQRSEKLQAIIHHVFFWLKEPGNAAHIAQLKEGLRTLKAIPQVQQLFIGVAAATEKREVIDNSYQVSELIFFHSLKDQAAYQTHPIHKAFIEKYGYLWTKVVVYDVAAEEVAG